MANSPVVTSEKYPYLQIRFRIRAHSAEDKALIDTGFTGHLAIPTMWQARLGRPDGYSRWILADGTFVHAFVYLGTVDIIGLSPATATNVVVDDEYILGRRILDHFEITLDHGRRVIVRPESVIRVKPTRSP